MKIRDIFFAFIIAFVIFNISACATNTGDTVDNSRQNEVSANNSLENSIPVSNNPVTPSESSKNGANEIDKTTLFSLIGMSKDEIIRSLGADYEEVASGPEGSEVGLYFDRFDITIDLNEDEIAYSIASFGKIKIDGVSSNIKFAEAEKILKANGFSPDYDEIFIEESGSTKYFLSFEDNGYQICLSSFEKDGADSLIEVGK